MYFFNGRNASKGDVALEGIEPKMMQEWARDHSFKSTRTTQTERPGTPTWY